MSDSRCAMSMSGTVSGGSEADMRGDARTIRLVPSYADRDSWSGALMIGEALVDVVPTVSGETFEHPGGSPLNAAVGLGRLGRPTVLATWMATDARGDMIATHLTASHVGVFPNSLGAERTSTAEATFDEDGSAHYIFDFDWRIPPIPSWIRPRVVSTGSLGAICPPGAGTVLEAVTSLRHHATIFFDPNIRPQIMPGAADVRPLAEEYVRSTDVVKVSDEDLTWLYPERPPLDSARAWLSSGPALVVMTRGAQGAIGLTPEGQVEIPTAATVVVDTVGAGDSFLSGLIHLMWQRELLGADKRECLPSALASSVVAELLAFASSVAAITLSRQGADPPWLEELGTPAR